MVFVICYLLRFNGMSVVEGGDLFGNFINLVYVNCVCWVLLAILLEFWLSLLQFF